MADLSVSHRGDSFVVVNKTSEGKEVDVKVFSEEHGAKNFISQIQTASDIEFLLRLIENRDETQLIKLVGGYSMDKYNRINGKPKTMQSYTEAFEQLDPSDLLADIDRTIDNLARVRDMLPPSPAKMASVTDEQKAKFRNRTLGDSDISTHRLAGLVMQNAIGVSNAVQVKDFISKVHKAIDTHKKTLEEASKKKEQAAA